MHTHVLGCNEKEKEKEKKYETKHAYNCSYTCLGGMKKKRKTKQNKKNETHVQIVRVFWGV